MDVAALRPGLAQAGEDAARLFRGALEAMSVPGRVVELAGVAPPEGLGAAAGALLLTLADADTPLWIAPERRGGAAAAWLRFHANLPFAETRDGAVFGLGTWEALAPLSGWPSGTPAYPDRSASLIVELGALEGGPPIEIMAPGLTAAERIAPALPQGAADMIASNSARFPLGVDLFLASGSQLMALPRTVQVRAGGQAA